METKERVRKSYEDARDRRQEEYARKTRAREIQEQEAQWNKEQERHMKEMNKSRNR